MKKHSFSTRLATSLPAALAGTLVLTLAIGCSQATDNTSELAPATPSPAPSPELFTEPLQRPQEDPAKVLVTVNGKEITAGELNKELDIMADRMQGRVPPERLGQMRMQMRDQLLENIVTRKVLMDKVAAENITVTDAEFDEAVTSLSSNLPPGMTLDDMLEQAGTSKEEFREQMDNELKIRKLIEAQAGGTAEVTEEEALAYYEENKQQFEKAESVEASHILISTDPEDSDEQKAEKRTQLEALRTQINSGADFAELAREHSSCPSKAQGGSLGSFTRGRMVPEFEAAAFSQDVGQIGDVVETQFGYHLIRVDSRSEAGSTPFEEVKEQLTTYLGNQKQQKIVQDYVKQLRDGADVNYSAAP